MPLVDLSLDTLTRLRDQLKADLAAVERALGLLKKQGAKAPEESPAPAAPAAAVPQVQTPDNVVAMSPTEPVKLAEAPVETVLPVPPAVTPPAAPAPATATDLRTMVREVIGSMEGQFGISAVKMRLYKLLSRLPDDNFIRSIMRKMVAEGALRQLQSNVGRGGSVFELPLPPSVPGDPADGSPPSTPA